MLHRRNLIVALCLFALLGGCNTARPPAEGGTTGSSDDMPTAKSAASVESSSSSSDDAVVPPSSAESADASASRTLLTPDLAKSLQQELLQNDCDTNVVGMSFSFDAPTQTASYANGTLGFAAEIPFNPDWGTERYAVAPFEELSTNAGKWLAFGPLAVGEGCGVSRTWSIVREDPQTVDEVVREFNEESHAMYGDGIPESATPIVSTAGGNAIVKYTAEGFCESPIIRVIGPKAVYRIEMSCADASQQHFGILETVAASMTFSD